MKQDAKEIFKQYLSDRGFKTTKQRFIILEQIIELNRQLDADEVFILLRTMHLRISHGTIYSALKMFVDSGILREVHFGDGVVRYEPSTEERIHSTVYGAGWKPTKGGRAISWLSKPCGPCRDTQPGA